MTGYHKGIKLLPGYDIRVDPAVFTGIRATRLKSDKRRIRAVVALFVVQTGNENFPPMPVS